MPIQKILVVDDSKTELMVLSDLLVKMATRCEPLRMRKRPFVGSGRKSRN